MVETGRKNNKCPLHNFTTFSEIRTSPPKQLKMSVQVQNPHLKNLKVDFLYHFMIDTESTNLVEKFGDTKFVVMGGSEGRMAKFAKALYNDLKGRVLS